MHLKGEITAEFMLFNNDTKDKVFNFITCTRSATFSEDQSPTLDVRTPMGYQTAMFGDVIMKVGEGLFYVIPRSEVSKLFVKDVPNDQVS